jgi:hypothetical protein
MERKVVKLAGRRGWTICESRDGSSWTCESRGRGFGTGSTTAAAITGAGYDDGIGPINYKTKKYAEEVIRSLAYCPERHEIAPWTAADTRYEEEV